MHACLKIAATVLEVGSRLLDCGSDLENDVCDFDFYYPPSVYILYQLLSFTHPAKLVEFSFIQGAVAPLLSDPASEISITCS